MTIKFTAQNFGCLKDFSIDLQPLHALIGPNDSGKSTVLRALATFGAHTNPGAAHIEFRQYIKDVGLLVAERDGTALTMRLNPNGSVGVDNDTATPFARPFLLRLDPDEMRQPAQLLPSNRPLAFQNERGAGLPAIYDRLVKDDQQAFLAIATRVRELFPVVKALRFQNIDHQSVALAIELVSGETVGTQGMSEGLLYYLAFAALSFVSTNHLVLIEEPENGLHPARIREVMNVLKEVSKTSQVVIATHSPLVINELEPDQVSIITRNPVTGSKATPMRETKNFQERSSVFALGELWLSFADGDMEKDLVPEAKTQ